MADMLYSSLPTADYLTTNDDTFNSTGLLNDDTQQLFTRSKIIEIPRILQLVIRPVLIVFGTIGNGLSFYVMRFNEEDVNLFLFTNTGFG